MATIQHGDMEPSKYAPKGYPWDEWFNGQQWLIKRGEDFTPDAQTFRTMLYSRAKGRGLRLRASVTKDRPDEIRFQVVWRGQGINVDRAAHQ